MSKIRFLKGNLEKKSVQTTLKTKGLKVAIAGALVGTMSVTIVGCNKKEVKQETKPSIEEKVEEKKEETKEEKKEEKVEEKKEEKVEEVATQESTVTNQVTETPVQEGRVIIEDPVPVVRETARVSNNTQSTKPSPSGLSTKPSQPKEETKPSQPAEQPKPIEEPKPAEEPVQPPVENPVQPPVEDPVQPPVEEPVDPPVEEPVEEEVEIDEEGFRKDGYLTGDKITSEHIKTAEGRYKEALVKEGYVLNDFILLGSYRETIVLPVHEDNGLNEKEIEKIKAVLDKYGSTEFSLLISRDDNTEDGKMNVSVSFTPDMTDSDGDGYPDVLVSGEWYTPVQLDYLTTVYRNLLSMNGYPTVDYVEGAKKIGEATFKVFYNNGKVQSEYNQLMNIIDATNATNVSLKLVNGEKGTFKVLLFGESDVMGIEEPVVEERPYYIYETLPSNYLGDVEDKLIAALVNKGFVELESPTDDGQVVSLRVKMYKDYGEQEEDIQQIVDQLQLKGAHGFYIIVNRKGAENNDAMNVNIFYKTKAQMPVEEEVERERIIIEKSGRYQTIPKDQLVSTDDPSTEIIETSTPEVRSADSIAIPLGTKLTEDELQFSISTRHTANLYYEIYSYDLDVNKEGEYTVFIEFSDCKDVLNTKEVKVIVFNPDVERTIYTKDNVPVDYLANTKYTLTNALIEKGYVENPNPVIDICRDTFVVPMYSNFGEAPEDLVDIVDKLVHNKSKYFSIEISRDDLMPNDKMRIVVTHGNDLEGKPENYKDPRINVLSDVYITIGHELTEEDLELEITSFHQESLEYSIDKSNLNINAAGSYEVIITATDNYGSSTRTVNVHVSDPTGNLQDDKAMSDLVTGAMLDHVNVVRGDANVGPVTMDETLNNIAVTYAQFKVKQINYKYNDGNGDLKKLLADNGVKAGDSTVIYGISGYTEPGARVSGMMDAFDERVNKENLTDSRYTKAGVGSFTFGGETYTAIVLINDAVEETPVDVPVEGEGPDIGSHDAVYLKVAEELEESDLFITFWDEDKEGLTYNIDKSQLNVNSPGVYDVVITASNAKGTSQKTVKVYVVDTDQPFEDDDIEFSNKVAEGFGKYLNEYRASIGVGNLEIVEDLNELCKNEAKADFLDWELDVNLFEKSLRSILEDEKGLTKDQYAIIKDNTYKTDVASCIGDHARYLRSVTDAGKEAFDGKYDKVAIGSFTYGGTIYTTMVLLNLDDTVAEEGQGAESQEGDQGGNQGGNQGGDQGGNQGEEGDFNRTGNGGAVLVDPGQMSEEERAALAFTNEVSEEIIKLVNEERAKANLSPLTFDETNYRYAFEKSYDMLINNYLEHQDSAGLTTFDYMRLDGIPVTAWAENIASHVKRDAKGTAKAMMDMWMNSEHHRNNILGTNYSKIGVGIAFRGDSVYATQIFTN